MSAARNLVRVQEKGQVTLPAEVRKRLGLKKGDLVSIVLTPEGALITPQNVVATRALDEIGEALREQGLSLEDMIERGRAIRGQLLEEQYGIADAGADSD
ncbi:MAG TPA: AbrB/MazE/SpoVT family DNA-binding domain-containing protein [Thermomicrobiales bacterium]|nr:AbrB/MazE/SpoVT family DNA-binding domain-containing protein [Thermomicrobiales bacterium]